MQDEITFDPILDLANSLAKTNDKVHIRIKQRNGKKSTTTVENLPKNLNIQTIAKKMRKTFHCNGAVQTNDDGSHIMLFGDQRLTAKNFLINNKIVEEANISVHGY
ncbi:protein translation factor SUI1-like 2 [Tupanvirus soda lake]|uniref:Protein translation factor SUI1-like 2 n=2 Tax=Tupanvirus TaxID=2094720 RepID=A0A6N1NZW7_9VIRU|nr:protein translation factor SUI1-like 2 [Tupanvirus soda lake]QKU35422.1 protein translation factor SUI1-like 2 [Tupanvirus soda lake]